MKPKVKSNLSQLKKNKYFTIEKIVNNYVYGTIKIRHEKNEMKINRNFNICIKLSKNSFNSFFEMENEIPNDYHHHTDKDPFLKLYSLCLAINAELDLFLKKSKSINDFIDYFVIPYFFNFSCFEKYGKYCWDGYEHGFKGVREYYKEKFAINDDMVLHKFFKLINDNKTFLDCPCGSNKSFKECHFRKVSFISNTHLKIDAKKFFKKEEKKKWKNNKWK